MTISNIHVIILLNTRIVFRGSNLSDNEYDKEGKKKAEHTLFAELVDLCVNLEGTTKKNEKTQFIEAFLHQLKEEEISPSVFLILGTIFPASDPRALNVSGATVKELQVE